jgi:hypothetical protein
MFNSSRGASVKTPPLKSMINLLSTRHGSKYLKGTLHDQNLFATTEAASLITTTK